MYLDEKDKNFITRYNKLYKSYIGLFIFIIFAVIGQFYFIFVKLILVYTEVFKNNSDIQSFVYTGLKRCAGTSLIWVVILVGSLIGNIICYRKIKSIFNKVIKEEKPTTRSN